MKTILGECPFSLMFGLGPNFTLGAPLDGMQVATDTPSASATLILPSWIFPSCSMTSFTTPLLCSSALLAWLVMATTMSFFLQASVYYDDEAKRRFV